jgi:5'-nucleotidase
LIETILELRFASRIVVNVNFPACPPEAVRGVAATVQGHRDAQMIKIDARADGRGLPYYWIGFERNYLVPGEGTDLEALERNFISVTPLRLDLTDDPSLSRLAEVLR